MTEDPLLQLFLETGGSAEGRAQALARYAFAVPTPEALDALARWASTGVVELGAGTGYWSRCVAARGVSTVAYDVAPAPSPANEWFADVEPWFPVLHGDESAVVAHVDRCLLLVWPTRNEVWPAEALRLFHAAGGQRVIFVGEGPGGRTGDAVFHRLIGSVDRCEQCAYGAWNEPCLCGVDQLFRSAQEVPIPRWEGCEDRMLLLERVEVGRGRRRRLRHRR